MTDLSIDLVEDGSGYANTSGVGDAFQSCCDVNSVPEEIIPLNDHVAQMNAYPKPER